MNDCWREQWIFGTKQINFFKKDVFFRIILVNQFNSDEFIQSLHV
jgi:hypothetical protein